MCLGCRVLLGGLGGLSTEERAPEEAVSASQDIMRESKRHRKGGNRGNSNVVYMEQWD